MSAPAHKIDLNRSTPRILVVPAVDANLVSRHNLYRRNYEEKAALGFGEVPDGDLSPRVWSYETVAECCDRRIMIHESTHELIREIPFVLQQGQWRVAPKKDPDEIGGCNRVKRRLVLDAGIIVGKLMSEKGLSNIVLVVYRRGFFPQIGAGKKDRGQ